jgi:hypothetical protein
MLKSASLRCDFSPCIFPAFRWLLTHFDSSLEPSSSFLKLSFYIFALKVTTVHLREADAPTSVPLTESSKTVPVHLSRSTATSQDGESKVRVKASRAKDTDDIDAVSIANAVCHEEKKEEKKEEKEKKGSSGDANDSAAGMMMGDDINILLAINKEFRMKWPYVSDDGTFQVPFSSNLFFDLSFFKFIDLELTFL